MNDGDAVQIYVSVKKKNRYKTLHLQTTRTHTHLPYCSILRYVYVTLHIPFVFTTLNNFMYRKQ